MSLFTTFLYDVKDSFEGGTGLQYLTAFFIQSYQDTPLGVFLGVAWMNKDAAEVGYKQKPRAQHT